VSFRRGRIVIAGTGSGVGKTSLTLGLVRALRGRGLRVQAFKVGPDFLDPSYLALASGRPCYNLDGWMTDRSYVQKLFNEAMADADIGVIEGVMGLFDGADSRSLEGSTGEIAVWLDAPVLLVAEAHGVARSLAPLVKGFAEFEPAVRLAGVIANRIGGQRHATWLAEALAGAALPPLLGAMPAGAVPSLRSRHLGLVTANTDVLPQAALDILAQACEKHLDLDRVLRIASQTPLDSTPAGAPREGTAPRVRIGIARDEAFQFYYPDNLEMLREAGASLVEFSPLTDPALPAGLGGLYLGGGYPEVHAKLLAANKSMLADIRRFATQSGCIYAECGGLMYLGRSLTTLEGRRLKLCGLLPIDTAMLGRLQSLGYVEASPTGPCIWTNGHGAGVTLRGHEFHYSHITHDDCAAAGWQPAYTVRNRRREETTSEGYRKGRILASYVHMHFASHPAAAEAFLRRCLDS